MANGTKQDIELRIGANDLGTKELRELVDVFQQVKRAQEEFARSGDLSARSIRELRRDMSDLERIGRELAGRGALIDLFEKQEQSVKQSSTRLEEAKRSLESYKKELAGVSNVSRKQQTELGRLEKGVLNAEKAFKRASGSLDTTRQKLKQLGLSDTATAKKELVSFANEVGQSLKRSEQNIRSYDRRLHEKRQTEREAAQTSREYAEAQKKVTAAVKELEAREEFREVGLEAVRAAQSVDVLSKDFDQLATSGRKAGDGLRAILDPSREAIRSVDGLERELEGLEAQLNEAQSSEELREQLRGVRNELAQLTKEAGRSAAALGDDIGVYRRQSAEVDRLRQRLEAARAAVIDYGMQVAAADQPNDELARSLKTAQARLAELTAQFDKESVSLANLRARLGQAGVDTNNLANAEQRLDGVARRVVSSQERLGVATTRLGNSTRQTRNELGALNDQGRKALSVYQRIRGQVLALASTYIGLFGAVRLVRQAIEAQQDRQALQIRLLVAAGNNTREAAEDYAFLRHEAERLGFALNDLGNAYSKIRVSGRAVGLSVAETRDIFTSFAEVSRTYNLSIEETEGVFRALEQIMSKGKVQAEELRGQLGDRLPGAFVQFAKATGRSVSELDKALEQGLVQSEELLDFARQYASTVQDQLPEATKTLRAEMGRLQTDIQDFLVLLANSGLEESARRLIRSFREFLSSDEGARVAQQIASAFGVVADVLIVVIENFDLLVRVVRIFVITLSARLLVNIAAGFLRLRTSILATVVAMRASTRAAVGLRRALYLINPAALVLGLLTEAVLALSDAQDENIDATNRMRDAIEKLEISWGDEKDAAEENLRVLRDQTKEKLLNARATLEQAKAEAERARARAEREVKRDTGGALGVSGSVITAQVDQTAAEVAVNRLQGEIEDLEDQISAADKALGDLLSKRGDEESEKQAAIDEALLKKRKKLEKEAYDFILGIRRDLLSATEDNLDAQLELIDIEYNERIKALRELQGELREVGLNERANQLDAQAQYLESLRIYEKLQARKKFLQEQEEKREEKVTKEMRRREEALQSLIEERDAKIEQINTKRELGLLSERQAMEDAAQVELDYRDRILRKIEELVDFIETVDPDLAEKLGLKQALIDLQTLSIELQNTLTAAEAEARRVADTLQQEFASGATQAFRAMGSGLADVLRGAGSLTDAFKSAGDAFREFAADFLIRIGEMILQAAILRALQNSSTFGGLFQSVGNVAAGVAHTGGVVGRDVPTVQRSISPGVFMSAPRYHSGGVAGLRPNEVPAVLQRGEEVLTQSDPRHRDNGGGAAMPNFKIVNAIDSASVVEQGLQSETGQRTFLNLIRANKAQIRQFIG